MDVPHNQVFSPSTLAELFVFWNRFPNAVLYAGGTGLLRGQGGRTLTLPTNLISLAKVEELKRVTRTERYLEMGSAVSLGDLLALGKIVPEALSLTLKGIANPQIRNLGTIGGNICSPGRSMDAAAVLVALDARYELRSASAAKWVSSLRFETEKGVSFPGSQELLTRVRVPLEQWDYTVYRKIGHAHQLQGDSSTAVFIARAQKDILSEVRLVFSGPTLIRERAIEASLAGKTLPLARREAQVFLDRWKTLFSESPYPEGLLRATLLNFIESAVMGLAD